MKRRSRLILPLAAFSLLFSVAVTACGGGNNNQQQSGTEEKITITAEGNKKALILGDTVQLTASVQGVTWSSSDEAVATVSSSGLVESKAVGKTTIKAVKSGYKDGSLSISVDLPKIAITPASGSIKMEETIQLEADQQGVTWASSDNNIATVDQTGKVTGVYVGSAQISASKDGYNAGKATITVTRPDPLATLHWEDADHIAADGWWSGSNNSGETPIYDRSSGNASNNTCIAHFDTGDQEILGFTSSAAAEAELVITMASRSEITNMASVMTVKLNDVAINLEGKAFAGGGDTNTFVEFSLGNQQIKKDDNYLELDFLTSSNPYIDDLVIYSKAQATIQVKAAPVREKIEVEHDKLEVEAGKTVKIVVTKPTDLTGVSFTSTDTSAATVDNQGVVTGVSLGSANIIVKKEGMNAARVAVTVKEHEEEGEIRLEAELAEEVVAGSSSFMNLTDGTSGITRPHSGGGYISGYNVSGEETLTFKFEATAAQVGKYELSVNGSPAYGVTADFMFATSTTITMNDDAVTIAEDAKIQAGDGSMSAPRVDATLGEANVKLGENVLVVVFHGSAPSLDFFRLVPKA